MTNYEKAFKELYEAIQESSDQALRLKAMTLREAVLDSAEAEKNKPVEELISAEEFNRMTYTDRIKLKNEKPDVYSKAIAGQFKEVK